VRARAIILFRDRLELFLAENRIASRKLVFPAIVPIYRDGRGYMDGMVGMARLAKVCREPREDWQDSWDYLIAEVVLQKNSLVAQELGRRPEQRPDVYLESSFYATPDEPLTKAPAVELRWLWTTIRRPGDERETPLEVVSVG
jgi:hypothetical protein